MKELILIVGYLTAIAGLGWIEGYLEHVLRCCAQALWWAFEPDVPKPPRGQFPSYVAASRQRLSAEPALRS